MKFKKVGQCAIATSCLATICLVLPTTLESLQSLMVAPGSGNEGTGNVISHGILAWNGGANVFVP